MSAGFAAVIALALARAQEFPDIRQNHWVFVGLADIKKAGLLIGLKERKVVGPYPITRREIGDAVDNAITNFDQQITNLRASVERTRARIDELAWPSVADFPEASGRFMSRP